MPGYPQSPIDIGRFSAQYGRFPTAEEMKTASMSNNLGFDNSALMQDPKFKQQETMNQGNMVSEPYFQANKMAAEKTNPMNAISQETPVGDRVSEFLRRMKQTEFEPVATQDKAKRKDEFGFIRR